MKEPADRKLYLGPRLRVLRRDLGINQSKMAEELGVSPSYLNHLERNQRPLTAQMLLRLANTYDIDIRDFVAGAGDVAAGLAEMLSDDLVRDIGIPRHEILDVAENYPSVVEAVTRFYRALTDLRRVPDMLERMDGKGQAAGSALDWLREFVAQRGNHFPDLDAAAEEIAAQLGEDPGALEADLRARLKEKHGITVRVMPADAMVATLRVYDLHRRRLMLSERLAAPSRLFALAYQLAMAELADPVVALVARSDAPDEDSRRLLAVALTNSAAAALLMPYGRFHKLAEESRYDLDLMQARFGVSFEQLAHRLTTLGRNGERGVPFFMLKIDRAGTVSKRLPGEAFPFARFGGACPRWNLYESLHGDGRALGQLIETPDGRRFVTFSRALPVAGGARLSRAAIGLGCDVKYAPRLGFADALLAGTATPTTVGPACHLCEREACPDRALPPITRTLEASHYLHADTPYAFRRV
jgi:predicted transcriptional regulator/transcriptional regulator with XRE-family HTH domain